MACQGYQTILQTGKSLDPLGSLEHQDIFFPQFFLFSKKKLETIRFNFFSKSFKKKLEKIWFNFFSKSFSASDMMFLQTFSQLLSESEQCGVTARNLNWCLLLLSTVVMIFARKARQGNPTSITITFPHWYPQFSRDLHHPNSTHLLFYLYTHGSLFRTLISSSQCPKKILLLGMTKKKYPIRDRRLGLDSADKSTRDVFNDVSKYICTMSISLNAVLRRTTDNPDMPLSPYVYVTHYKVQGYLSKVQTVS